MRRARVHFHREFDRDFGSQVAWLERQDEERRITQLEREVREVVDLLGSVPQSGRLLANEDGWEMRSVLLRKAPFIVWYLNRAGAHEVWLLRLLHAHQQRAVPSVGRSIRKLRR